MSRDKSLDAYAAAWRSRFADEAAKARSRAESARRALPRAVEILVAHGARKVVLFGSMLSGQLARRSDIDLAVEGLPPRRFTRALSDLIMELDFPVDLKPLDQVDAGFRAAVLSRGEVLYDAT